MTLFDAIAGRPWLAAYFMRDTGLQPHGLELYEPLGQQVLRLGLGPRDSVDAVSAVMDPAAYPFLHHVVEVFATHDDAEQFRAGLDLLLAGVRLRAGA